MDAFTPTQREQLKAIVKEGVEEAFEDLGLRMDGPEQITEAREDFRFLRRMRKLWDSAVTRVGTIVLTAVVGLALSIVGMGFWQWISRGGH